jgi:subtilisin family serine protease
MMTVKALGEDIPYNVADYDIENVWDLCDAGAGVHVGVADTGWPSSHVKNQGDLKHAMSQGRDFTKSRNGINDLNGHSSHCCGTIGAKYANGRGICGVAHSVDAIDTAKVLGDGGNGSDQSVAQGVEWLVDEGSMLINLSLGSPYPSDRIKRACEYANKHGVLLLAAAGNEGAGRDTVGYPAKWDNLAVAVGAIDQQQHLATFSSTGPSVDVVGPGVRIKSTYLNGQYAELSGTSMATPWLTGCFALRMAYMIKNGLEPRISVPEALKLIQVVSDDLGRGGLDQQYGWGVPQVRKLVTHGITADKPKPTPGPSPGPAPKPQPAVAYIQGNVNGKDGKFIFVED